MTTCVYILCVYIYIYIYSIMAVCRIRRSNCGQVTWVWRCSAGWLGWLGWPKIFIVDPGGVDQHSKEMADSCRYHQVPKMMDYDYGLWLWIMNKWKKWWNKWWIVMEWVNYDGLWTNGERMDYGSTNRSHGYSTCGLRPHLLGALQRGLTIPDSLSGNPMRPTGALALENWATLPLDKSRQVTIG